MATAFIFDFGNKNISANLPAWAQDGALYVGHFTTPYKASYVTRPTGSGKLTVGFAKALCRAAMIFNGCDKDGFGRNDKYSIAEFTLSNEFEGNSVGLGEVAAVAFSIQNGAFFAERSGVSLTVSHYGPAPFILAMWPVFMEHTDFESAFLTFCSTPNDEEKKAIACYLCDMVYELVKNGKLLVGDASQIKTLTATRRSGPRLRPDVYSGNLERFSVDARQTRGKRGRKKTKTTAQFIGAYAFRKEPLSPEQEARVPKLDAKYIVTSELEMVCEHIQKTTGKSRPIRNILYRGAPGVGKSESYVGIAAGCGLPLYTFAANAMTEPFDLFGQFIPVDEEGNQVGDKVPVEKILKGMPSAEEISMDPGFAYQQITGMPKKDATPTECMAAMFNLAQKSLDVNGGQQRFKFAPGQLIYALRDGGVWGLDEVTLPQNPGVIPALNPAMDNTQAITLPTGEVIHRHPDCIIVGTTNIDLEGCRTINQAWQDRCQLIIDLPEPTDDVLKARIQSMVDWDENEHGSQIDLDKFILAYHQLQELARKRRMEDGTIGPRKLADWVASTMITNDPILSANITIVPGATSDPKNMAELREKLTDLF